MKSEDASCRGRLELVGLLVSAGANPNNRTGPPHKTPLQVLASEGQAAGHCTLHQTPRAVFCICSRAALRRTEYSPTTPSQSAPASAIASMLVPKDSRARVEITVDSIQTVQSSPLSAVLFCTARYYPNS